MSFGEGVAGTALQVLLKITGEFLGFKRRVEFYFPWRELGGGLTFTGVMFREPLFEIGGMTAIELFWLADALKNVSVEHGDF